MANPYDKAKWGVEIVGHGDILPCKDFKFAVKKAEEFNNEMLEVHWDNMTDNDGCLFCIVVRWDDNDSSEHDPDSVNWHDPYGFTAE